MHGRGINKDMSDLFMRGTQRTRTPGTIAMYTRVVRMLQRRVAQRASAEGWTLSPRSATALASELRRTEGSVSLATARLYRAAVDHAFGQEAGQGYTNDDLDRAMQILERDEEESGIEEEDRLRALRREREKRFPRGAQQRAYRLSLADLQRLLAELRARGERGREAADWYMVTVLTGLRPCEWRTAGLLEDSLRLSNAKSTNGRAFAPTRTIDVSGLLGPERECLIRHLSALDDKRDEAAFARQYKAVRTAIRDAGQRLWPKRLRRPSLYTARHQFAAGAKTTWPPAEVAALMGHGSVRSAPAYYAPARSALGGVRVRPSDADVRAVKARNALDFLNALESRDT